MNNQPTDPPSLVPARIEPAASQQQPSQPYQPQRITPEQRAALLAQTIATQVAAGQRVESQGPVSAVLVSGREPNHVLQLLLTVFTCGLWAPVWLIVALAQKERRTMVTVDDFGYITVQHLG